MSNKITLENYKEKKYVITHKKETNGFRFNIKVNGQDPLFFFGNHKFHSYGIQNKPIWGKEDQFHEDQFHLEFRIGGRKTEESNLNGVNNKIRDMFDWFDNLFVDYCVKNISEFYGDYFGVKQNTKKELIPEFVSTRLAPSFRPSKKDKDKGTEDPVVKFGLSVGQYGKDPETGKAKKPKVIVRTGTPITLEVPTKDPKVTETKEFKVDEQVPYDLVLKMEGDIQPSFTLASAFLNTTMLVSSYECKVFWLFPSTSNKLTEEEISHGKMLQEQHKEELATEGQGN